MSRLCRQGGASHFTSAIGKPQAFRNGSGEPQLPELENATQNMLANLWSSYRNYEGGCCLAR